MINPNYNLTIKHDDNGTFTDYSRESADYLRDSYSVEYVSLDDYIYVGYEKPIQAYYVELSSVATSNTMTGEYYNGTTWNSLEGYYDDSMGMSRSGFVQWNRKQTNQVSNEVDGLSKYWYRFKLGVDASLTIKGINIIFNDINDLKAEFFEIDDPEFLPSSGSFIHAFVNARNNIIQRFRSKGYSKTDSELTKEMIGPWDMLDIHEVRIAAAYFSLYKIMFTYSDAPDDIWAEKALYYQDMYAKTIDGYKISIDTNDNGEAEEYEKLAESRVIKFSR